MIIVRTYIKLIFAFTLNSTFVAPQILPALFQKAFANVGNTQKIAQKKSGQYYSHCEAILCGHRWLWLRPKTVMKWLRKLEVWELELVCLRLSLGWKMLGNIVCICRFAFLWILFSAIFYEKLISEQWKMKNLNNTAKFSLTALSQPPWEQWWTLIFHTVELGRTEE